MPEANLFLLFTRRFDEAGTPYMVSGSVASILYSVVRLTNDVDLIATLDWSAARKLQTLFPSQEFYVPPIESIGIEMARDRRGHFNIIHIETGFKADVYLSGDDPFHAWAFQRARKVQVGGAAVNLAPPEYVIVRKLEYFQEGGSEKHMRDIRSMLEFSGHEIDGVDLDRLIHERHLSDAWESVRRR